MREREREREREALRERLTERKKSGSFKYDTSKFFIRYEKRDAFLEDNNWKQCLSKLYIFLFTLLITLGARLPVLGPFLAGGTFGSNT